MKLTNLYATRDAFKVAVSPSGEIVRTGEAEACEGTVLVTGNCRKAVTLRVSIVSRDHLEALERCSREKQMLILARVKAALETMRAALVFFYEAAWRCAVLRTAAKAGHRLQTLPQEVQARKRRASNEGAFRLGARAEVLLAA